MVSKFGSGSTIIFQTQTFFLVLEQYPHLSGTYT